MTQTNKWKKVAVIGAGAAGLCTARYASAAGHEVTVYEQTSEIGGTWVYTDRTGTDDYGLQIHTSMYQNLRTLSPKEIMDFWHFPMSYKFSQSYISSDKVLNYLHELSNAFDLKKIIKFRHHVIRVRPQDGLRWEIIVKDLPNSKVETHLYDAVFVCNGHFSQRILPQIPGLAKFTGTQEHSHDYRNAENYRDKSVLIIGIGISGTELMSAISKTAKNVTLSCRVINAAIRPPTNVTMKGVVQEITETGAIFVDGSEEKFDNIIYCTGYTYSYPFLSVDCGINVDENYVYPLYRHCINITHPTMYFIGLPNLVAVFLVIDIQVRYCLKFLNDEKLLPPTSDMLNDTQLFIEKRKSNNIRKKKWYALGLPGQREYFDELCQETGVENFPDVIDKIQLDSFNIAVANPLTFRNYDYKILNEHSFERHEVSEDI